MVMPPVMVGSTVVEADTPCRRCGYDLRGMPIEGRCPECGTPVERSLRGNLLCHADPAWVDGLAIGARGLAWATSAKIGGCALALLGTGLPGTGVWLGGHLLWVLSAWPATSPDPGDGCRLSESARTWVRRALVPAVLGTVAIGVVQTASMPRELRAGLLVVTIAGTVADAVGVAAMLRFLQGVAGRTPDGFFTGPDRFEIGLIVVPYGCASLVACWIATDGPRQWSPATAAVYCLGAACICTLLASGFRMHAKLTVLAASFARQAATARRLWTATDSAEAEV